MTGCTELRRNRALRQVRRDAVRDVQVRADVVYRAPRGWVSANAPRAERMIRQFLNVVSPALETILRWNVDTLCMRPIVNALIRVLAAATAVILSVTRLAAAAPVTWRFARLLGAALSTAWTPFVPVATLNARPVAWIARGSNGSR